MKIFRVIPGRSCDAISLPAEGVVPLDVAARLVLAEGAGCVLLAAGDVLVNGGAALPAVVLEEGDEIRAGSQTYIMGPRMEGPVECTAADSRTCCARCNSAVAAGERVLLCPACRAAHHPECWGYAPQCAGCGRHTAAAEWRPQ